MIPHPIRTEFIREGWLWRAPVLFVLGFAFVAGLLGVTP